MFNSIIKPNSSPLAGLWDIKLQNLSDIPGPLKVTEGQIWWYIWTRHLRFPITVVPLLKTTLTRGRPSYEARIFCPHYYKVNRFSLSPKATSLMWPQFVRKWGGLIRGGLLYYLFNRNTWLYCLGSFIRYKTSKFEWPWIWPFKAPNIKADGTVGLPIWFPISV